VSRTDEEEDEMGNSLNGRVAIVTGAGRGIGASVARLLATEGASVIVNDLGVSLEGEREGKSPAEEVVADISKGGGKATGNGDDVADFVAAEAMINQAIEVYGRLDILVNVAGILRDRMVFNMSEEEWDAVVRVHMKGTFNTVRHASAYWRSERNSEAHNRIINFTSGAGLHGSPGHANYAAAKLGIVGFTYSCANALGKYGVTANAVAPVAATRMIASMPDQRRPEAYEGEKQEGSPDNIAPAVAYLASERSDWCTGQVIEARGYQIGLYNVPEIIRQIASPGPWDLDVAARMIEDNFKPVVARSGGHFDE
jgi:NAD(P)-dependent dehydrogenase (short-subunit alcohol dehydrogenase family)